MNWLVLSVVVLGSIGAVVTEEIDGDESVIKIHPYRGEELPPDAMSKSTFDSELIRSVVRADELNQ